jgi:hypothetical protein
MLCVHPSGCPSMSRLATSFLIRPMRWLVALVALSAAGIVSAAESMHIDGVLIFGKTHDVSVSEIRDAINESTDKTASPELLTKPRALEVVDSKEIHAYLPSPDLGWIRLCKGEVIEAYRPARTGWNARGRLGLPQDREALRLIKSADEIAVFPVTFTRETTRTKGSFVTPHRDHRHLRWLPAEARHELAGLLGTEKNWFEGFDNTISLDHPSGDIGFVFRKGRNEVVLLRSLGLRFEGTYNGENAGGSLEDRAFEKFTEWKRRYAAEELAIR